MKIALGRGIGAAVFCLLLAGLGGPLRAQQVRKPNQFRDGVVLAAFRDQVADNERASALAVNGARLAKRIGKGVHVLDVGPGRVRGVIQSLLARGDVLYAEPDYIQYANGAVPNDASFGNQWGMQNVGQVVNGYGGVAGADAKAVQAWSRTTGTNSVVVAILDSGIQYTHPDLVTNMWRNPGGVNGCAAGTVGFNVINDTCDPMDDEVYFDGHGTHVAGLAGAAGNNGQGISGAAWTTSLMAVKWIASDTSGATSSLIEAMDWVIRAKQAGVNVRVVNSSASYSGDSASQALRDEIDLLGANNILFVTSSGNANPALNNDITPTYPCSYNRPNQICTAALDQDGTLWVASNYGPTTVKLGAPGANILSTLRRNNYGYISGGSMAAPIVSAAAALVLSVSDMPVATLRSAVLAGVDSVPSMVGRVETGGRINLCKAIPGCATGVVAAPAITTLPVVTGLVRWGDIVGAGAGIWSGMPSSYTYQWMRCNSGGGGCAAIAGATSHTYAILDPLDSGATLAVTVRASNGSGAASAQSPAVTVANGTAPFSVASSILNGSTLTGSVQWQVTPSQTASFVQFYVDGVLAQTVTASPYIYNKSTTGLLDTSTLSAGRHVLGARVLSADNRVYSFVSAAVTVGSGPVNTGLPVIGGTPATVGRTLTTSNGTWTGSPTSFAYQWNRCNASGTGCSAIAGATAANYTVAAADAGNTLRSAVTATNGAGSTQAMSAFVNVPLSLAVTTSSLPGGVVGSAYSATLAATGGASPYTWSVTAGTLPAGLSLSASTGTISGTPTVSGTSNFTVQVRDAAASTATRALSIVISTVASPIALVQSASRSGLVVSSLAVPFGSANTAGNLIAVFIRMSTSTQTVTVTDSAGNVYANAVQQVQNSDGHRTYIFYARNVLGRANTVTARFSAANNHPFVAVYEYRGLSRTAPLDRVASAQGSSASVSAGPTATTTAANELLFGGVGFPFSWSGTVTAGAGYTMQLQDLGNSRAASEARIVSGTGSYTLTFGLSGATEWSAVLATFK